MNELKPFPDRMIEPTGTSLFHQNLKVTSTKGEVPVSMHGMGVM